LATVQIGDGTNEAESETVSSGIAAAVEPGKALGNPSEVRLRHPLTCIGNLQANASLG
jgi:hypothetical protein